MFKGIVMEVGEKYIIIMKEDGEFLKIKKKDNLKIGSVIFYFEEDIYVDNSINSNKMKKFFIPLGTAAALILILFNPILKIFSPKVTQAYAIMTFDINPSIQFSLDNWGKVLDIKGINNDGNNLNINVLKGLTVEEAMAKLKTILMDNNYLNNDNSILVGFSFMDQDNIEYENRIETTIKDNFTNINLAFIKGNKDNIIKANEEGISLGRYEAILKLKEDDMEDALEGLTTQDLLDLLKKNNSEIFLTHEALDEIQDELEDRNDKEEQDDKDKEDKEDDDHDLDDHEIDDDDEIDDNDIDDN